MKTPEELNKEIISAKKVLADLYKERTEMINEAHFKHGIAVTVIAKKLDMKYPNVIAVLKKE